MSISTIYALIFALNYTIILMQFPYFDTNSVKSSFMPMHQQDNQQVTPQVITKKIDILSQTAETKNKLQQQKLSNVKMRSAI